jgi:hypothetical protein
MSTKRPGRNRGRDLITTAEIARDYGLSVRTVHRAAQSGELPYAQKLPGLRGAYVFDPGTVALWARQNGRLLKKAS